MNLFFDPEAPRPNWPSIWMGLAAAISNRSTCARLSVGCVITTEDNTRVLALGYNGNYRGGPHDCDSTEVGKCGCIHAESNALLKYDFSTRQRTVAYVTHVPCRACAKLLINAEVNTVVYLNEYRDMSSVQLLKDTGTIQVYSLAQYQKLEG